MQNRNPLPANPTQITFGLVAWLEQTRVPLPLKGVECRFSVCGDLLDVELDQIFHQNSHQPLDCLYTFPLPAGAAVYRCEMIVNGRVIRARVEELEAARKLVREQKAAGHRTALVEMERDNLFTLALGNVQPGDLIVVRFAYFQTLTRLQDWTSFHIPFCPGVRYIPGVPLLRAPRGRGGVDDTDQVPDASRISPPRMDWLHPDAAYLSVEGTVANPASRVRDLSSPSHPLVVRDGEANFRVTLAENGAVPDRDLVLRWTEPPAPELGAMGWLHAERDASYALLRLVAPEEVAVKETTGQDIYFLVDRSGSMQGLKWLKAAQAFREFTRALGPQDRVWATFFEEKFRDLAEQPLPPETLLADRGVLDLESLGTGGGTELLPALEHVLRKITRHSAHGPAVLVLITDGQVGNEAEILQHLAQHPALRVHTFGIDVAVNDAFLKQMAAQQRGTCHLVTPNDDIVGTIARLGQRLRRPVLTGLQLEGPWEAPVGALPDLHGGEVVSLSLKGPVSAGGVSLRVTRPDGSPHRLEFALQPAAQPALRLLWARQHIGHLEAAGDQVAALQLARESNLICRGAAFVAWDEAQKVTVAGPEREVYQPSCAPGVHFCLAGRSVDLGSIVPLRRQSRRAASGGPQRLRDSFKKLAEALKPDKPHPPTKSGELHEAPPHEAELTRQAELLDPANLPRQFEPMLDAALKRARQFKLRLEVLPQIIAALLKAWQTELATLPHGQRYQRLAKALLDWVEREPAAAEDRFLRLRELLIVLRESQADEAARLTLLHAWIEHHIQEPASLRTRALEEAALLRRIAAAGQAG